MVGVPKGEAHQREAHQTGPDGAHSREPRKVGDPRGRGPKEQGPRGHPKEGAGAGCRTGRRRAEHQTGHPRA